MESWHSPHLIVSRKKVYNKKCHSIICACLSSVQGLHVDYTFKLAVPLTTRVDASNPSKSAMLRFVGLFSNLILLLQICLHSSSSILNVRRLSLEEPSALSDGGKISEFSTLKGTTLTGYFSYTLYSDAKCTSVRYFESYPLNVCFPWLSGTSSKMYANGTHLAEIMYSDYSCTKQISSDVFDGPSRVCDSDFLTFSVTDSFPTIVSSTALLSAT